VCKSLDDVDQIAKQFNMEVPDDIETAYRKAYIKSVLKKVTFILLAISMFIILPIGISIFVFIAIVIEAIRKKIADNFRKPEHKLTGESQTIRFILNVMLISVGLFIALAILSAVLSR
jgi:uncharacterized BrkB/YihY/UPF0761 family membrane protein